MLTASNVKKGIVRWNLLAQLNPGSIKIKMYATKFERGYLSSSLTGHHGYFSAAYCYEAFILLLEGHFSEYSTQTRKPKY